MSYDHSNPEKYNLWCISGDGQGSMHGGAYDTKEKAEAAIPEVEAEFRSQCPTSDEGEDTWDEDAYWQIDEPTPEDDG